jgi:predicted lipid-binding transport protein (Tim44 family)
MDIDVQYFDILLFAVIAAFVIVRLGRALGRRPDDNSQTPSGLFGKSQRRGVEDPNVVTLPERAGQSDALDARGETRRELGDDEALAAAGVAEIRLQDPGFDVRQFLAGAREAYEMVVTAFAAGDRESLRRVLSREVLDNFSRAIQEREERGEQMETTVIGVDSSDVVDARMAGKLAEVTVKFVSQLINVVRDREGREIGSDAGVKQVVDVWTFVRDVRSVDPNWALAETRSPA